MNKKSLVKRLFLWSFAEGEGFKPPIPEKGIPDFESSAIDHSANLPSKREQKRACSHFVERKEGQLEIEPSLVKRMQRYNIILK